MSVVEPLSFPDAHSCASQINRAISITDDPLDPASWYAASEARKTTAPRSDAVARRNAANVTVLRSGNGVYGPGSACVYNGPGERPWIAYSAFYMPQGFVSVACQVVEGPLTPEATLQPLTENVRAVSHLVALESS